MENANSSAEKLMDDVPAGSRRRFLQVVGGGATLAGAGLVLPAGVHAASPEKKKIRLGIVGGRFGLSFHFHLHPDCVVTGVAELRPERLERLSKTYGCDTKYPSLEVMLREAKDIDAVAIFTDGPKHVEHSIAALKAGKHVLCAVPAGMTLEECAQLVEVVEETGLTFMMAETSYWQQSTISARKFYEEGKFGSMIAVDSCYQHDGIDKLFEEDGKKTWRHGFPPMNYPTHCTAHYIGVLGGRLTEVTALGWGDNAPSIQGNPYDNPFFNSTALFKSDTGLPFSVKIWWKGAIRGGERAEWVGDQMSFYGHTPNGQGPVIVRKGDQTEKDDAGFVRNLPKFENYEQTLWWKTDMLPAPLRINSGHEGSHTFITHEFIDALLNNRRPAVDVYESVAYTAPGIVAQQSALKGGELMKIPDFGKAKQS